jgi:hypothetical protein
LRASGHVHSACALGLWRPVIVVSHDLLETLDDEDLDQVVMHEHAHLARYDDWTRLAQAVIEALVGLHPAIALIGRHIDIEREAACDDRVIAETGAARRYAACLATVGAASLGRRVHDAPTLLPGMARSRGTLLQRVGRLLDPRRGHGVRSGPATGLVTAAALLLAITSSRRAGPMVEVIETVTVGAPASVAGPRPTLPAFAAGVPAVDVPGAALAERVASLRDGANDQTAAPLVASQSGLAAPSQQINTAPPAPPALETTGWHAAIGPTGPPSIAPTTPASVAARAGDDQAAWAALATAGGSIGTSSKKAGVAVAGFFSRAAKATASSF